MVKIILYIAISADGFIADKQGGVAWLDKYNTEVITQEMDAAGCGFKDFYDSIDALIIGSTTYRQMVTFGPWAFTDKMSYVFSADDTLGNALTYVERVQGDIPMFVQDIASKGVKRAWLVGGAQLAASFYRLGLIDEYIITIVPDTLGEGIALLPEMVQAKGCVLVDTKCFASGIVQHHYKRS